MTTNLEINSVHSDLDQFRFENELLKKEIMKDDNLEKGNNPRENFDYISETIRSKGVKSQKKDIISYEMNPINSGGSTYLLTLEERSTETTLYLEVKSNNIRKYLYKVARDRNNNFELQRWTYSGDSSRPETYDFKVETKENLNDEELADAIKLFGVF